ncbi:hypothetical protein EP56_15115 [Listeriaceae bacterium FSL A5-0209]|nr:hypothetical protein EP56_15115 [Listeriaceae bacterium FSL A5-0209]
MALEITIQENDKRVNIKVDDSKNIAVGKAIGKAFELFGLPIETEQMYSADFGSGESINSVSPVGFATDQVIEKAKYGKDKIVEQDNRSKRLPLKVNGEHDTFKPRDTNVQVRYVCPECSDDGHLFAYLGNKYSKCPSCKTKIFNEDATDKPGEADPDGNVYLAYKRYLTPKERFEYKYGKEE